LSSILKALKKLEADPVHQGQDHPWPGKTASTGAGRLLSGRPWFPKVGVPLMGLAGVLIVLGWLVFDGPFRSRERANEAPRIHNPVVSIAPPLPTSGREGLPRSQGAASARAASRRQSEASRVRMMPGAATPAPSAGPYDASEGRLAPVGDMASQENRSHAPGSVEPETADGPPLSAPPLADLVAERKDDRRLTLQAIAWSPASERRMAVINDRIVKEGSAVDGIRVVRILDNHVVLREDGLTWKIVFNRH
jgi:hypothetical protein